MPPDPTSSRHTRVLHAIILFPPPELKILYETLVRDLGNLYARADPMSFALGFYDALHVCTSLQKLFS